MNDAVIEIAEQQVEAPKAIGINEKQQSILKAISMLEEATVPGVAKYLSITSPAVTGSMASLKKNGLMTITEGVLKVTEAGLLAMSGRTAEQRLEAATVGVIERPSIPKAEQVPAGPNTTKQVRTVSPRSDSKTAKAQAIFDANPNLKRSELMQLLKDQVGLTENGANTYIHNMRKAAGMVTARLKTAAPTAPVTTAETVEAIQPDVNETSMIAPDETLEVTE